MMSSQECRLKTRAVFGIDSERFMLVDEYLTQVVSIHVTVCAS